jgi:hypothetical protein
MSKKIRTTGIVNVEKRGGPVEVCEHIELPSAYPENSDLCEYTQTLLVKCSGCNKTYQYTIKVN